MLVLKDLTIALPLVLGIFSIASQLLLQHHDFQYSITTFSTAQNQHPRTDQSSCPRRPSSTWTARRQSCPPIRCAADWLLPPALGASAPGQRCAPWCFQHCGYPVTNSTHQLLTQAVSLHTCKAKHKTHWASSWVKDGNSHSIVFSHKQNKKRNGCPRESRMTIHTILSWSSAEYDCYCWLFLYNTIFCFWQTHCACITWLWTRDCILFYSTYF